MTKGSNFILMNEFIKINQEAKLPILFMIPSGSNFILCINKKLLTIKNNYLISIGSINCIIYAFKSEEVIAIINIFK